MKRSRAGRGSRAQAASAVSVAVHASAPAGIAGPPSVNDTIKEPPGGRFGLDALLLAVLLVPAAAPAWEGPWRRSRRAGRGAGFQSSPAVRMRYPTLAERKQVRTTNAIERRFR